MEMVQPRSEGDPWPLALVDRELRELPLKDARFVSRIEEDPVGRTLVLTYRGEFGRAVKRLRLRKDGRLDVSVRAQPGEFGVLFGPGVRAVGKAELENRFGRRRVSFRERGSLESLEPTLEKTVELPPTIEWVAFEDNYFLAALIPAAPTRGALVEPVRLEPQEGGSAFRAWSAVSKQPFSREQKSWPKDLRVYWWARGGQLELTTFWGAKDFDRLAELPYGLEETVRWGRFGFLVRPLLAALQFLHERLVPNWGWAIVILTVLLKLLLLPLSIVSFRSMRRMRKLAPRMQEIRDRYRPKLRDKQGRFNPEAQRQMNEEVMALYRSEGVNPASGCLPILVQIPIFLAFYNMLSTAVELKWAPWVLWIQDLSEHDPWYLLPIVMGATQFVQQRMTPPPPDPFQRRMLQMMPILFTLFSFGFPSGLVLYWLTNNVVSIGQQVLYNRMAEASEGEKDLPSQWKKGSKGSRSQGREKSKRGSSG
jgi:YidC/Oxa1 family membrane protein insertase